MIIKVGAKQAVVPFLLILNFHVTSLAGLLSQGSLAKGFWALFRPIVKREGMHGYK
jgi:hypothetical protein